MSHPRVSHLSDPRQNASAINHALRMSDGFSLTADQLTLNIDRNVDVTGTVNASTGLKVAGIQVVGAQQAAIPNDASGAINQATVNAILTALRTTGIIAA